MQLMASFEPPSPALISVAFLQLLLLPCIHVLSCLQAKVKCLHRRWITSLWIIVILLDVVIVTYIHPATLEREKEYLGRTCVIVFMEVLKMIAVIDYYVTDFNTDEESSGIQRRQQTETNQQGSNTLHLCNFIMYMFGAVGLVLLNSVTLTAELIMKARNGERIMKDLRLIVFPSECVFALYWLILLMYAYCLHTITGRRIRDTAVNSGNPAETHELENLTAPDSVVSQTQ